MKLSFAITLLLSSLGFGQVPAAPNPAETGQVQAPSSEFPSTELPSDGAKPPVRTQPFGELLTPGARATVAPDSSAGGSSSAGSSAGGNIPVVFESRIDNPRSVIPAQLPRKIDSREIDTHKLPLTPPQMIAAAMNNDDVDNRLSGRSMKLVEALSYANTPQRQLKVIHAYWYLVSSVARYNLECRLVRRLEDLGSSAADGATMQTSLASAAATREEARCVAITAQHALAEAAMLGVGDSLPLPADLPHVGAYRTRFAQIFSVKPAPPRMRLIDRALPIHCKAINARALAIMAADKSLQAAMADRGAGRGDFEGVVSRIAQLNRQHLALVDAVCNYNHEIVEYAVASLAQPISGPALVAMLIETKHGGATHFDRMTHPASAARSLGNGPLGNGPTLAPPRMRGRKIEEPQTTTPATRINPIRPPRRLQPPGREPARLDPHNEPEVHNGLRFDSPSTPASKEPLRLNPSGGPVEKIENAEPPRPANPKKLETGAMQTRPVVPVQTPRSKGQWTTPALRTTTKPDVDSQGFNNLPSRATPSATGLYPDLMSASPTARAKHLVQTLHSIMRGHGDRNLPADAGRPIELADYLGLGHGINRQALVEAFWLSRQRAAEFQVLAQQTQLLDEIRVPQSRRLEAARLATKADAVDAHIRLLEAQFLLTNLVRKTSEPIWLSARGAPRSAVYNVATIASGSDTWEFRRRRAMIPAIHQTLCRRAVAVVEADVARATAIAAADQSVDAALDCTFRQTEETLALLASVTAYNNAIARHVLRVLPPGVSNRVLAEKLMAGS